MTDDRYPSSLLTEDLAHLRERALAAAAQALIDRARDLQERAASLRAENAMVLDEVCFRRMACRKRTRFPSVGSAAELGAATAG